MVKILALSPFDGLSEFAYNLLQSILETIYTGTYTGCESLFNGMFNSLNNKMGELSGNLTQSPQAWNATAFGVAENVAKNACIPIAGVVITFVFCWELIHLMQESNQMHNIKPDTILIKLITLAVCLLVCSKSFEIVMGFYEIGSFATKKVSQSTNNKEIGEDLKLEDFIEKKESDFSFWDVLKICMDFLALGVSRLTIMVCGVIIHVRVLLWFIELLIYSSVAPIPFATFGNKDWSQMGMNYVRKMLAVCFEGFFMLLIFAMYGGVLTGGYLQQGDFFESILMIIGGSFAFVMLLYKAGSISASIFNAH